MISDRTRQVIFSALFIALGFIFPMFFHMAGLGKVFLPMFWPLAACGFFLSPPYAILVGILTPVVSRFFTGMPPTPVMELMMIELTALTITASLLHRKSTLGIFWIVLFSLLVSRLCTFFIASVFAPILGLPSDVYSISRVIMGIPGMIAIMVYIPLMVSQVLQVPEFCSVKHVHSPSRLF